MFQNIHVIKFLSNHYFVILQACWPIKIHILYQINKKASEFGYYFTNYGKFSGNCWIEELRNRKPVLPLFQLLDQYLESDKRQVLSPVITNLLTDYYFMPHESTLPWLFYTKTWRLRLPLREEEESAGMVERMRRHSLWRRRQPIHRLLSFIPPPALKTRSRVPLFPERATQSKFVKASSALESRSSADLIQY